MYYNGYLHTHFVFDKHNFQEFYSSIEMNK